MPADTTLDEYLFTTLAAAREHDYDHVIVGGGCMGAVLAERLLGRGSRARILMIEQGSMLLPDHVQNCSPELQPLIDTALASPWQATGEMGLAPHVPYLGGRALFWSSWVPQPRPAQLRGWPEEVVAELEGEWEGARAVLGVRSAPALGQAFGPLHTEVRRRVHEAVVADPAFHPVASAVELDAQLATASVGGSGGYRRFSPVPLLLDLQRRHGDRFRIVTGCAVNRLDLRDGRAVALDTAGGRIELGGANVVLATGTVESTAIVLASVDEPGPVGRRLDSHLATWFTCRVRREEFDCLSEGYQTAAVYVDGPDDDDRQFHVQVIASASTDVDRDRAEIFRCVPDMFGRGVLEQLSQPGYVVFLVHGNGEVVGRPAAATQGQVVVGADGRVRVTADVGPAEHKMWDAMDAAMDRLVSAVVGASAVEYWCPDRAGWFADPPAGRRQRFVMHESGSMRMGAPGAAATDLTGRLHGLDNVYVAGAAVFPSEGSWNPTLTMTAMARRLAAHLMPR